MGIPHALSSHPAGSPKAHPFWRKGGKRRFPPYIAVALPNGQVGQELKWLSCSGLEAALSNLLWEVLTEAGLTISSTGHCKFKGGPSVISESIPFGYFLFWSFEESINSLVVVPNLLNGKSYLGQTLWHLCANKSITNKSNHPLSSLKQIQNRTSKVHHTKGAR